MARLKTQINQIYLTHPETKKVSLILHEEKLNASMHLFLVAELKDIQRKSQSEDLKKISEIILGAFHENKKLPAENLFESCLAQINQHLADLAHSGKKSWLGKFSCLIALKTNDTIYLTNTGHTCAWLKRKSELSQLLPQDKKEIRPLKSFNNFTQGKLLDKDGVILTTSNIFNFVSLELFSKTLNHQDFQHASSAISRILQDSTGTEDAFCTFFLAFEKEVEGQGVNLSAQEPPMRTEDIYAPFPENLAQEKEPRLKLYFSKFKPKLPKLELLKVLPQIKFQNGPLNFFRSLSPAAKFFLISFLIFFLVFSVGIIKLIYQSVTNKTNEKINQQVELLDKDLNNVESDLIIKNNEQAIKHLNIAQSDYQKLTKLAPSKSEQYTQKLQNLTDRLNHTSVISNPKILAELRLQPKFLSKSQNGLLLSGEESNSISVFETSLKDLFLLNALPQKITGTTYLDSLKNLVTSGDKIYRINRDQKIFEVFATIPNSQLEDLKALEPNRLYVLDKKNQQIYRININNNKPSSPQTALKTKENLNSVQDLGVDKDIYLLLPDGINKVVSGKLQALKLETLSIPLSEAQRIFVATNLYVLEPAKKRLIIYNKNGVLLNQIYFPNNSQLKDLVVDETQRSIYLLDSNKLLQITY